MSKGRQLKTVVVPTASKAGGDFKLTSMGKPKKQKSAKNQPMKKITAKMPTTKQKIEKAPAAPPFFRKFNELLSSIFTIPLSEKLFFTENLRVMVKAGLSISEALETLALQTKNKKFKKVLQSVSEGVTGGNSLGSMLEQ